MNKNYSKYNKYGDSNFSWQNDCIENIKNHENVILSSPTGSGKTKVFLEWAQKKNKKQIIITAPIKALSNQRYRELLAEGYTVGLETGDIKNVPDNCDFICCTQEIYTNKYLDQENITLVMDEFHYIFENSERARTYIDALHKSKATNILLCSATLGDVKQLTEYVDKVSGRDFYAYENNSRLTSLYFEGDISAENIKNSLIVTFSKRNIIKILESLYDTRDMQDEETIETIQKLAENDKINNYELIQYAQKGISGYYGALLPKEKLFIEKCFEQGMIDTVVGTDALALGVNFPVENVIFAQLVKYYDGPISKNLFDQLAGRAGRKGYFDKGHVYYCSDFAKECEALDCNTEYIYKELLEQGNEDVSIILTPNIKNILLEKTTIGEEAEFISKFSTEKIDEDYTFGKIFDTINYINNYAFENEVEIIIRERFGYFYNDEKYYYGENEYEDNEEENQDENDIKIAIEELLSKKEEFSENIAKVYFEEYSPEINCKIFADILCGVEPDDIIEKYGMIDNFNNMLQFRKYVKALPKKYRKGLTKINDIIREIDETAIDGFRGNVSVEEISEQLEQEGKFKGKNVMKVLKEQEDMQKMNERLDVIEEQLRIAEQYGLEDY